MWAWGGDSEAGCPGVSDAEPPSCLVLARTDQGKRATAWLKASPPSRSDCARAALARLSQITRSHMARAHQRALLHRRLGAARAPLTHRSERAALNAPHRNDNTRSSRLKRQATKLVLDGWANCAHPLQMPRAPLCHALASPRSPGERRGGAATRTTPAVVARSPHRLSARALVHARRTGCVSPGGANQAPRVGRLLWGVALNLGYTSGGGQPYCAPPPTSKVRSGRRPKLGRRRPHATRIWTRIGATGIV